MSTVTRPAAGPPARHDEGGTLRDALRWVNSFLTSKHTGLALILVMAIFALIGTMMPQEPDGARADLAEHVKWLDGQRVRFGGWTDAFDRLGMFHIFSSVWFQLVSALLAASIIACTVHRLPTLWQRAMHPHRHVTEPFFDHAVLRSVQEVALTPQQALDRATTSLRRHRYRVVNDPKHEGSVYADRYRFMPFGTAAAHAAFVLIIVGVAVTGVFGFRDSSFTVTVGSTREIGRDTGLAIEVKSFADTYYNDGRPADYASDLVVHDRGQRVAQQTVRVNNPLRYGGLSIHQTFFGTAAVIEIKDGSGAVVFSGGVPMDLQSKDERNAVGKFRIADKGLQVYAVVPASGKIDPRIAAGEMLFEVYRDGQDGSIGKALVSQGKSGQIEGLTYTFVRERQFTGLTISRDPGAVFVWIGSALMMVGLMCTLFFRHRRIWVRVHPAPGGALVKVASPERHNTAYESWFRRFVSDICSPDAGTHLEKAGQRDA